MENRGWTGNPRRLRGSTSKKIIILFVGMGTIRKKTEWRPGKHPVTSSQVKVLFLLVEEISSSSRNLFCLLQATQLKSVSQPPLQLEWPRDQALDKRRCR